jgi:nitroreductase
MTELKQAMEQALEALEEIALAGMSGTGMESEEGVRDWHARRAWEFIGIAARALPALRAALSSLPDVQTVPEGYALVPLEATQDMLDAAAPFPAHLSAKHPPEDPWHAMMRAATAADQSAARVTYRVMVAAASAPKEPQQTDGVALGEGGHQ